MRGVEHSFVVAELHGRLGNQLFQFASSYAIARRRNAQLLFTSSEVGPDDLLLPKLIGDTYEEASPRQLLQVGQYVYDVRPRSVLRAITRHSAHALRRVERRTPATARFKGDTGRYRPEVFDLDLPVYLQAHLESEQYFAAHATEVMNAIRWPPNLPNLRRTDAATVAVSFRRGDFNSLGRALPLEYYERSLEFVIGHVPSITLVVFGDDSAFLELAVSWLERYGPVINALELANDPISQLHLMTQCDHHVIANSSFAWWGAWIAEHARRREGRFVVAPDEYRGGDRIPARWHTVAAGTELNVW